MAKICPQRVIATAIKHLSTLQSEDEDIIEDVDNNLQELQTLSDALYRDGIINISE